MNFSEALEKDLTRLSTEIKEQQAQPGAEKLPARELVRQSIQAFTANTVSSSTTISEENTSSSPLPDYLQKSDPRVQLEVERLVQLVFQKNLTRAVYEAKRHPPFVEDAFHDALIDKLLPELKKRGAIK